MNRKQLVYLMIMTMPFIANMVSAQVARKHLSDRHQQYYDSLRTMNYNYIFPVLGEKVYKRGFDIPFPFGIMINNFYGSQGIDISNIRVGIKGPDSSLAPVDLSNVIEFRKVDAKAYNINARVDMYVLPFLNVYALLNYLPRASTLVELSKPVDITSEPTQNGWAWGLGIMGAGGVGPVWIQGDYSATWANMQLLDNKVFTQITGLRIGHAFTSRKDAQRSISVWIGMMGIFLNNETVGQIALSDVFSGVSQEKINEIKDSYDTWYAGLDKTKQRVVDYVVNKLQDRVNNLPVEDIYITYEMDKKAKSKWAGLVGAQYQFNKRWQVRAESNFISSNRFSILASVNYRFLGFKKKNRNEND